ncbi:hypothetical protein [Neobacillus muris]|uniref:hypothetical protein n=1 Tax=Neobacillus muris TaxID=2941334 RepID=UPI0020406765|nr:hypothetical protein [Neobacillus muris]
MVRENKIKKPETLLPILNEDKYFEIPNSWMWIRLQDIILEPPKNGYSPKGVDYPTSTKNLTLTATSSGFFKEEHFKYIEEEIPENSYLWLKKGDILIQRSNSLEKVGISCIYDGNDNAYIFTLI